LNATISLDPARPIGAIGRIRIILRLLAMVGLLVACVPLYYLWRIARRRNPWPRVFLGGIAWIAGVRLKIAGKPARRGAFLLANHVSWLDVPILAGASGTAFVAHSGLQESKLLTWLCAMNDTVFVARHDRRTVHEQVEQVRSALSEMGALTIFPEGTTSDGTGLLPFKSSLLSALDPPQAGICAQPVWIDYGPDVAGMAWVGEEHGLNNFLRILARGRPLPVTVHFLEAFEPGEVGNRKAISAHAREAILAAMASSSRA
jgi:1-acyl-sn-glycerol-3-phosphate acyltransferase